MHKMKIRIDKMFPFLEDLEKYNLSKFKADFMAGLTIAIVGTPQAIAYAVIAGVDPRFGLYACIVPVIIASLMGSSRFLVAGPTNTVSMVIFSTIATLSINGASVSSLPDSEKMQLIFLISVIAGLIQIAFGVFKAGSLLNFVSHSVIVGFTAGAGILIGFGQLKNFLGLSIHTSSHFIESTYETFKNIGETDYRALFLGVFTIAFIVGAKKISSKIPASLIALIISGTIVFLTKWDSSGLATIGSIPKNFPPLSHPSLNFGDIQSVLMPSLAIAILGVVEAYSIAKSFSSKSGDKLDSNQEFIGQGLANVSAGFFSGIPGTGSFTRSAVNFTSNAASRFSATFSAVLVLLIILLFADGAKFIPVASLAGTLIVVAFSMIDIKSLKLSFNATNADRIVLIATMIATLVLHLDQAVYIGVLLSIVLFLRKISHPQVFPVAPCCNDTRKLLPIENNQNICSQISIYQVEGSLFFGAISELEDKLSSYIKNGGKIVIVRLSQVRLIDATGVHALESLLRECEERNITMLFSNVKPAVLEVFKKTGILNKIGKDNFFDHTSDAISEAVTRVRRLGKCQKCTQKCFQEC